MTRAFKSIRWTLQLWHTAILLLALASFGLALYVGVSRARYRGVDAELQATAQVVLARLRMPPRPANPPPPPRRGEPAFDADGNPRQRVPRDDDPDGFRDPPQPRGADGDQIPGGPPPDRRPRPNDSPRRPGEFRHDDPQHRAGEFRPGDPRPRDGRPGGPEGRGPDVPPDLLRRPGENDADQPYFVVWNRQGGVIHASNERPGDVSFAAAVRLAGEANPQVRLALATDPSTQPQDRGNAGGDRPGQAPPTPQFRQRGPLREIVLPGPPGTLVLVGRSVAREQDELRELKWILLAAGGGVMVIGLAGGWMLSSRVVRPIGAISATARTIADRADFARRIDVAEAESELGSLAATLNDAFARLEGAYRQQSRFTADASHELRTPLSVMHSHLELALSRDRSGEEYRQSLSTCLRASQRMRALVESLLTLARADAGRLDLAREDLDFADVARESTAALAPLADARQVVIETDLRPARVRGDRGRLAQVVTNLVGNAITYNRDAGRVRVTVGPSADGGATLAVSDTGVGIAVEDQPHLFERFFRADPARSRAAGGSGLGLAICQSIVDAHGGAITFESESGVGTTFTVRLPSPDVLRSVPPASAAVTAGSPG